MKALALLTIICAAIWVLATPLVYGKPRQPYRGWTYFIGQLGTAIQVAIAGRVLGWW